MRKMAMPPSIITSLSGIFVLFAPAGKTGCLAIRPRARASAVIYSLMLTCRACQVKPWDYLNEVLTELPKRPDDAEVNDLLPWHFAQRQPVTKKPPSG